MLKQTPQDQSSEALRAAGDRPTILFVGSDSESLDLIRSIASWGQKAAAIRPTVEAADAIDVSDVKNIVLVADTPLGVDPSCESWVQDLGSDATVTCVAMPGIECVASNSNWTYAQLEADPDQFFETLNEIAKPALPEDDELRMSILGVAQGFSSALTQSFDGVAREKAVRSEEIPQAAGYWIRLPVWLPRTKSKWTLGLYASDEDVMGLAIGMTGMEKEDLEGEEEVLESSLGEVANIAAGFLKSTLYDMGISCVLRPPVTDKGFSPNAALAPLQGAITSENGITIGAQLWLSQLETQWASGANAAPGMLLAGDAELGETQLWQGDPLLPEHIQALKDAADVSVLVYTEDTPLPGQSPNASEGR